MREKPVAETDFLKSFLDVKEFNEKNSKTDTLHWNYEDI